MWSILVQMWPHRSRSSFVMVLVPRQLYYFMLAYARSSCQLWNTSLTYLAMNRIVKQFPLPITEYAKYQQYVWQNV